MTSLFATLLVVVLVSAAITASLASVRRIGLDHPKEHSIHVVPTPRLGGVAIFTSATGGIALSGWVLARNFDPSMIAVLGCVLGLFACFLMEDIRGISWPRRLLAQIVIGAVFVFASDILAELTEIARLVSIVVATGVVGPVVTTALTALVLVLGIVWSMNLYNFMDGLDGLAGGMAVSGFTTLGLFALWTDQQMVAITALAVAAGSVGFVIFNFPPAKIFLGDCGSVPLGFLAAALSLELISRGVIAPVVPLLIFAPFVLDATVTLIARLRTGTFWRSHRQHWYQRMALAGWSHGRVLCVYYPMMLLSAGSAVAYQYSSRTVWMTLIGVIVLAHSALPVIASSLEAAKSADRLPDAEQRRTGLSTLP